MTPADHAAAPKVQATWIGADIVQTPEHGTLIPGETTVLIGFHEAHESANWQPVKAPVKSKTAKTEDDA